ncbi:YiiD C-terminal domain-containing protein [Lentisalinibacter sediminis]|uniref:YiiD C-terminal domain-containing protein n=1 Tax=Lentisalinibacter sediminis TaxID=2992237 RepID=UPI003870174B
MAGLRDYLLTHIPLTAAMGVEVHVERPDRVVLTAPLAPNVNHQGTAFGGSVAALATLAAWSLVRVRLDQAGRAANVVIQRSSMEYCAAIDGELRAVCEFGDEDLWRKTIERLDRRRRARLELHSHLEHAGAAAARFAGAFVLLDGEEHRSP